MWQGRGSPQVDTRRPHVGQSHPEDDFVVVALFYYDDGLDSSPVRECQGCLWRDPSCVSRRLRTWSRRKRRTRRPWLAIYQNCRWYKILLILKFIIKYSFEYAKKEPLLCAAQCLWTQDEFPLSLTRPVMKNCILKVFFVWVDRSIGVGIGRKAFPSPWYHLWTSFGSFELIVLTAVQEREAQSLGAGERIIQQFAMISMDNGYGNGKMTKRRSHRPTALVSQL